LDVEDEKNQYDKIYRESILKANNNEKTKTKLQKAQDSFNEWYEYIYKIFQQILDDNYNNEKLGEFIDCFEDTDVKTQTLCLNIYPLCEIENDQYVNDANKVCVNINLHSVTEDICQKKADEIIPEPEISPALPVQISDVPEIPSSAELRDTGSSPRRPSPGGQNIPGIALPPLLIDTGSSPRRPSPGGQNIPGTPLPPLLRDTGVGSSTVEESPVMPIDPLTSSVTTPITPSPLVSEIGTPKTPLASSISQSTQVTPEQIRDLQKLIRTSPLNKSQQTEQTEKLNRSLTTLVSPKTSLSEKDKAKKAIETQTETLERIKIPQKEIDIDTITTCLGKDTFNQEIQKVLNKKNISPQDKILLNQLLTYHQEYMKNIN
jgi:hypothetical protein